MAKASKERGIISKKRFIEAIEEMGSEKGISEESLLDALEESFRVTFAKKIEQEYKIDTKPVKPIKSKDKTPIKKLDDALIRSDIDLKKAKINCYHQWLVVPDDEVEDDYIQIGLTDAKEKNSALGVGDYYEEELSIDSLDLGDVNKFMSCFRQKISAAEKNALLETFHNKIHTIVTGEVDRFDSRSVTVNLGRTTATLYKKDLIGDEKFNQGDPIKVYIEGIGRDEKKGSLIKISRSCPGFLRKLFENEIHEIYDSTVIIKDIARIAGKRSKVAVYSNDPNVDSSGACIGQNGSRIQAIVSQLGNAKDSKEKIDVITWNPNLGLYLVELLKPGKVIGMHIDEANSKIRVVCENGTGNLAIGYKGTNVILAKKLTGFEIIEVIEEADVDNEIENGIHTDYKSVGEFEVEAKEESKKQFRLRQEEMMKNRKDTPLVEENENFIDKDLDEDIDEEIPAQVALPLDETKDEETTIEKEETATLEEVTPSKVIEPIYNDQPVYKKEETPIEFSEVKTTTTLESLEKALAEEKKANEAKSFKKKFKKDEKKFESADEDEIITKPTTKMDIYTDEELQELDNELDDSYEDEEDYSDYDSDDYYEDK